MFQRTLLLLLIGLFISACPAIAQQAGSPDNHPKLATQKCTAQGCVAQDTSLVLNAGSRGISNVQTGQSCVSSDGSLDATLCPDVTTCSQNCAIQGIEDYTQIGISTQGNAATFRMYLNVDGKDVKYSPRAYLLDANGQDYVNMQLLNQEFAFTVDVSNLPCGMNGALYLTSMDLDGGRSNLNPAGASYGTGYGDAQCPKSAFINGVANLNNSGACSNEMDIWEANANATQLTPHACSVDGLYQCQGDACEADGVCDRSGCAFNPYKLGAKDFYAQGGKVDTSQPFTVITQFPTSDGTARGTLSEIKRFYVQNNQVIQNADVTFQGTTINSITDSYCSADVSTFQKDGGLAQMGKALARGMVLIFSIWNDDSSFMNWLDSGDAGPCSSTEGNPALIVQQDPRTSVTFSDMRWGHIGSTYPELGL